MFDIRDLLCLLSVSRVGSYKVRALVSYFKDPAEVLRASPRELIRVPGIEKKLASNIAHHSGGMKFANSQLKLVNRIGAHIVTIWDNEYPELLKKIYDPPVLLYVMGHVLPRDKDSLAIVGTRLPSQYGQTIAESIARELALLGFCIVSGLARGVDTIAHASTLKSDGRTIAVIGSGLDIPYPPENQKLMDAIAKQGAVVSEFPMGTEPDAVNFPRRNRIISGIARGTVVVESAEDGGAMITASTALDQNREVFAVPGSILEKRSAGPNRLIKEGRAKLVQRLDDILEELGPQIRHGRRGEESHPVIPDLSLFEKRVFDALSSDPIHIDALTEKIAMSSADALVNLLSLEFKGLVKQMPGKLFVRQS